MVSISWWWALFGPKRLIILTISLLEKFIESRDYFVTRRRFTGKTLLLLNIVHYFAKNVLGNSAFSMKSAMSLFSWKSGGIQGLFLII